MNDDQRGFSIVEILFVLIIAGLVSAVGYYVWHAQKGSVDSTASTHSSTPVTQVAKTSTFNDKNGVYSFQLPDKWTAAQDSSNGQFLALKPSGFKAPGQENDWVASMTVTQLPTTTADDATTITTFEQLKKHVLDHTADKHAVSQNLKIKGAIVWKLEENIKDNSATGPPELTGGYHDINYYYSKDNKEVVDLWMRTYQHASTNYLGEQINSAYNYSKYLPQFETIAKSLKLN